MRELIKLSQGFIAIFPKGQIFEGNVELCYRKQHKAPMDKKPGTTIKRQNRLADIEAFVFVFRP
jgi:hypothetical protein